MKIYLLNEETPEIVILYRKEKIEKAYCLCKEEGCEKYGLRLKITLDQN